MGELKFTISNSYKIKNTYKYKIEAKYYQSYEDIDTYLIADENVIFKRGNSYKCNLIIEEGQYSYIDNIKQIDIDINVINKYTKKLVSYLTEDEIREYLLLGSRNIQKKNFGTNDTLIKQELLKAYYNNYLVKFLNELNMISDDNLIEEILNKYKNCDIEKLFKENEYYFSYYFNIYNSAKYNVKKNRYTEIIRCLKLFEKKGHVFVYLEQLKVELKKYDLDIKNLIEDINFLEEEGFLIKENEKVYLKNNYEVETSLIENLKKRSRITKMILSNSDKKEIERVIKIIEKEKYLLNQEQIDAIYNAIEHNLTIITGGAGVGKTTIQDCIIRAIRALNNKTKIKIVAPTGKAANELNKKIKNADKKLKATTIHRLFNIKDNTCSKVKQIKKLEYLIIDEASMIDNTLFKIIISNIPITCKIIIVADINQCEAIGTGNPIMELIKIKDIFKIITLNANYRQGEGNIILKNANKILNCTNEINFKNNEFEFVQIEKEGNKFHMDIMKNKVRKLMKDGYNIKDITILAFNKEVVKKINSNIKEIYLPSLRDTSNDFVIKDKVMQIKNNNNIQKGIDVFNGEQGIITYIEKEDTRVALTVDFGDKIVNYDTNTIKQLESAYGLTIHKSQGSASKIIILLINKDDEKYLNRNILYTAITRAVDKVIIIGDKKTFDTCVCKLPEYKNTSISEKLLEAH